MVWYQKEGCGLGIRMVLLQMLFPPTGRGWFLLEMLSICATRLQSLCQQWQRVALRKTCIYYLQVEIVTFQWLLSSPGGGNWEDLR